MLGSFSLSHLSVAKTKYTKYLPIWLLQVEDLLSFVVKFVKRRSNIVYKSLKIDKRSSLFCISNIDEEEKFYNIAARRPFVSVWRLPWDRWTLSSLPTGISLYAKDISETWQIIDYILIISTVNNIVEAKLVIILSGVWVPYPKWGSVNHVNLSISKEVLLRINWIYYWRFSVQMLNKIIIYN